MECIVRPPVNSIAVIPGEALVLFLVFSDGQSNKLTHLVANTRRRGIIQATPTAPWRNKSLSTWRRVWQTVLFRSDRTRNFRGKMSDVPGPSKRFSTDNSSISVVKKRRKINQDSSLDE
ncbi:hypothetical protein EVAR_101405_1 [Eumeta japonica]|uniref:Uncharacterized protein n=1 Tax=Eumeta variegata TaxID=151549 RepID=A0A4C1T6M5_EUMVA|nr:hypothetical protein EVAR_101405_1 [Eumeta japonica]